MLLNFFEVLEAFFEVFVEFHFDVLTDGLKSLADLLFEGFEFSFESLSCFLEARLEIRAVLTQGPFDSLLGIRQNVWRGGQSSSRASPSSSGPFFQLGRE